MATPVEVLATELLKDFILIHMRDITQVLPPDIKLTFIGRHAITDKAMLILTFDNLEAVVKALETHLKEHATDACH